MKKSTLILLILALMAIDVSRLPGQSIHEILHLSWNAAKGVPYMQVPGANLAATSMAVVDQHHIALLCNSTSEILVFNKVTKTTTKRFAVGFAPRDFVYDDHLFYVLLETMVVKYDQQGVEKGRYTIPSNVLGVERLSRFNDETYLLIPDGNSLKIEAKGFPIKPVAYFGWPTMSGMFMRTQLKGALAYQVQILQPDGPPLLLSFTTKRPIAGVYLVGMENDKLYLDVQSFVSEAPIAVERNLVVVGLSPNRLGTVLATVKIPDCYYALSNRELLHISTGEVLSMVSTPDGLSIFQMVFGSTTNPISFPSHIANLKYHFNDHLITVDE